MVYMNNPALHKMWVLDAQWTDIPLEVEEVVKNLWRFYELGNDNYVLRKSREDLQELGEGFECEQWVWGKTPEEQKGWVKRPTSLVPLIDYLREKGVPADEEVIIHWWW
jgi:hypothetical protein